MRWQISLICAAVGPQLRRSFGMQNGGSGAGHRLGCRAHSVRPRDQLAAYHVSMTHAHHEPEPMADQLATIEDLARAQHAEPVAHPEELAADIWESEEELEAFLADLRASRNASLA
jgi:hypothetical protein